MTANTQSNNAQATASSTGIEAELIYTFAGRVPDVVLGFNGLTPPNAMFAALHELGWSIPHAPPPPGTAIDWTPDPVAGTDYTLRPWKVTEFRLHRGSWAPEDEPQIAAATVQVLRQHGANIAGLRRQTEAEEAAAAPAAATRAVAPAAPAAPAGAVAMLTLTRDDETPSEVTATGASQWTAKAGRERAKWTWSEGPRRTDEEIGSLGDQGAFVWALVDTRPTPVAGMITLQMVCLAEPDKSQKQVTKLAKLFGQAPATVQLVSATGGSEALLIAAEVPENTAEMLTSNLLLRFPKLILRG